MHFELFTFASRTLPFSYDISQTYLNNESLCWGAICFGSQVDDLIHNKSALGKEHRTWCSDDGVKSWHEMTVAWGQGSPE